MKNIDLGQTIQIAANVGVIASIVLLAIQLNQNNAIMAANARASRVSLSTQVWSTLIEQPEIGALLLRDRKGEALTDEEEFRLNAFWTRNLASAQYNYQDGPESRTLAVGLRKSFAAYGSLRRTWQGTGVSAISAKDNFTVEFVEFIDKNVADQSK